MFSFFTEFMINQCALTKCIPWSFWYEAHLSKQYYCWSTDWAKTTAKRGGKQLSCGIWCGLHKRFDDDLYIWSDFMFIHTHCFLAYSSNEQASFGTALKQGLFFCFQKRIFWLRPKMCIVTNSTMVNFTFTVAGLIQVFQRHAGWFRCLPHWSLIFF